MSKFDQSVSFRDIEKQFNQLGESPDKNVKKINPARNVSYNFLNPHQQTDDDPNKFGVFVRDSQKSGTVSAGLSNQLSLKNQSRKGQGASLTR